MYVVAMGERNIKGERKKEREGEREREREKEGEREKERGREGERESLMRNVHVGVIRTNILRTRKHLTHSTTHASLSTTVRLHFYPNTVHVHVHACTATYMYMYMCMCTSAVIDY